MFQEAGLPIGGKDFNPYVMLEIHYNNPEKRGGNKLQIFIWLNFKAIKPVGL